MKNRVWLHISMALVIVLASCGGEPSLEDSTPAPGAAVTTTPAATAPTGSPAADDIPGEVVDIGPRTDDVLTVVGIPHGGTVSLTALPGATQQTISTIDPLGDELIALGETRQLDNSLWIKVDNGGTIGWVPLGAVAYLGGTDDVTSRVIANLGETPVGESMEALGLAVAEALASADPPSRMVVVVAETVGDLGEVTYDVIGLGDDSVLGLRLHVFGNPVPGGFSLSAVEQTTLCGRGVTPDGLCV